jgi:alkanesulfonate monooxygenase SsuD/methylene tetrahydromethanopterin reductase-like flavin-dependent oxidoreductase (luciferase family)
MTYKLQFGWTLPPGYFPAKDYFSAAPQDDWMPGPQTRAAHERWDAGIRRALNLITGQWDSAWMTDHFFWPDGDCLEALTTLAYYAALTPTLNWGTMVLGQGYRNPAYTAKIASTIQYLTHGRLILGIGAGWKQDEYLAYGYPFPPPGQRIAELEEAVHIIKSMWTQPKTTFVGQHYQVRDAINLPQTPKPPLLMIGGGGEQKMLPLVARHADWWNSNSQGEIWQRKVDILKRECEKNGRDFASLRLTWFGGVTTGRTNEEVQRRLRDDFLRNSGIWGTMDEVTRKFEALVKAGCTYIMCDTRGIPEPGELESLIEISRKF